ncbi:hypothetical protein ACFT5B_07005 [Luteimicrobium sp. NPDC057192]|uniref:hypothetical protein n=1 Tax=Luteimicrobium sp. NPDC057192 TaxID=3346042 RepID=UPI00363FF384
MPQPEPIQGFPKPLFTDSPNVPTNLSDMYDFLLSRAIPRFPLGTSQRDAALPSPVDGMECVTGTGTATTFWKRKNGAWVASTETVTVAASDFFAPASGLTIASGSVEVIGGKSLSWQLQLTNSGGPSLTSGSQSVVLGSVKAPYMPRTYYAPFTGWPGSGFVSGLVQAGTGETRARWSDAAHSTPTFVIGGGWPI